MSRQPPPASIIAAAERDYHGMRDTLADLVPTVRGLLATQTTEVEVLTEVWLTLLCNPTRSAALLGATAIVQLAKQPQPVPADSSHRCQPGPGSTDGTQTGRGVGGKSTT